MIIKGGGPVCWDPFQGSDKHIVCQDLTQICEFEWLCGVPIDWEPPWTQLNQATFHERNSFEDAEHFEKSVHYIMVCYCEHSFLKNSQSNY